MPNVQYGYYVALVGRDDKVLDFSELWCDSALEASEAERFIKERDPKARTLIGYRPDPLGAEAPHICRDCNCQFDRRATLIA